MCHSLVYKVKKKKSTVSWLGYSYNFFAKSNSSEYFNKLDRILKIPLRGNFKMSQ